MEMAIGNAPWPVGVTRSGIHQRPGSAKAYVSNIAHVLNDETQRKYIQVRILFLIWNKIKNRKIIKKIEFKNFFQSKKKFFYLKNSSFQNF